jgi:predicted acetyltransferase
MTDATSRETDSITLRSPGEDQVLDFLRPLGLAFSETLSEEELTLEAKGLERDRVVGAFDGDRQVGMAGAYSFRLTVPGGEVGAAGITGVGVVPTHTRRGILRRMMTWLVAQARERGEPVAVLFASEAAIYQRFGYGLASLQSQFDLEPLRARFLRPVEMPGSVRYVDSDEATRLFPPIYDTMRRSTPGALSRTNDFWRWGIAHDAEFMRGSNGPKSLALLEVDGEPRAYAIYRIKADWDARGPRHTLMAIEVIGLDAASEQAMWQWLLRIDLIGTVKTSRGPVSHPLQLQLTEPRRLGVTINDGTWLRILDVDKALGARSYLGAGSLTFDLTDDYCPWNAGRWQLTVPGGGATATVNAVMAGSTGTAATPDAPGTEPDLALDVSALSGLYLGGFSFAELARAGRVTELRPGGLAAADALFATAIKPWNSTPF